MLVDQYACRNTAICLFCFGAFNSHQGEIFRPNLKLGPATRECFLWHSSLLPTFCENTIGIRVIEYGLNSTAEVPGAYRSQSYTGSTLHQHHDNHPASSTHHSLDHIFTDLETEIFASPIVITITSKRNRTSETSRSPTLPRLLSSNTRTTNLRPPLLPEPSLASYPPLDGRKVLDHPSLFIPRSMFRRPIQCRQVFIA